MPTLGDSELVVGIPIVRITNERSARDSSHINSLVSPWIKNISRFGNNRTGCAILANSLDWLARDRLNHISRSRVGIDSIS